ncbi:MAG: hypothetical protein IPM36_16505 [Lewinellaceae bacterium]|nr:hypothetical protein [Lewinellaceae bacterium]
MKQCWFISLLLLAYGLGAQNITPTTPKNALTLGVIGEGNTFSFQYNRVLARWSRGFLNSKIGVGMPNSGVSFDVFGGENDVKNRAVAFPMSISCNFGRRHSLELGLGSNLEFVNGLTEVKVFPTVGYKFFPANSGFTFRAFIHPVNPQQKPTDVFFPVGLSIGYAF